MTLLASSTGFLTKSPKTSEVQFVRVNFTSQPIDKIETELLFLVHFENDVPFHGLLGLLDWRLNGRLSQLVQESHFMGKAKEKVLLPAEHRFRAQKLIVCGLGQKEQFRDSHIVQVFDYVFDTISRMKASQVALSLSHIIPSQFEWRNGVRLFVSKAMDYKGLDDVILCEPTEWVQDAKRRGMDFPGAVQVSYDGEFL